MAKNKIERIDQEIAKTREKIAEQQKRLRALEAQLTEEENLETPTLFDLMGGGSNDQARLSRWCAPCA